jgi:hypothetical protein
MVKITFLLVLAGFLWLRLGVNRLVRLERQGQLRIKWNSWRTMLGCLLWPWVVREVQRR